MDDKTAKLITENALIRGKVRNELALWQFFPVIDSIAGSFDEDTIRKHTMYMAILEEIAAQAWRLGYRQADEDHANRSA